MKKKEKISPGKVLESKCFSTSINEDGICITRVRAGVDIVTIKDAKENTEFVIELADGAILPMMVDCREIKNITKEARDHFSMRGRKGNVSSIAIVIGSPVSQIIGNFFLGLNKPTVPTRLFTDETKALKWLQQFLN